MRLSKLAVLALVLSGALFVSGSAFAKSGYLSDFKAVYPGSAGGTIDSCDLCHAPGLFPGGKKALNYYGQDWQNAGYNFTALENGDADSDGCNTLDEITADSNPGDPDVNLCGGPTCTDSDQDGYAVELNDCGPVDCDDSDPTINPGAQESCTNGVDDDCDFLIDVDDPDAVNCPSGCTDADGDGYAIEGAGCGPVDCDDGYASINPGALENCTNLVDDDCDGLVDSEDSDCGACIPTANSEKGKKCSDGIDNDCDGEADCADPDDCGSCGGTTDEICDDSIDNDGDGDVDCADADCADDTACGGGSTDPEICDDGIDNDGDGKVDCSDKKDCGKDAACGR